MSNMSYCRFQNTVRDLSDCYDAMDEPVADLSPAEQRARKRLLKLCGTIAAEVEDGAIDDGEEREPEAREPEAADPDENLPEFPASLEAFREANER